MIDASTLESYNFSRSLLQWMLITTLSLFGPLFCISYMSFTFAFHLSHLLFLSKAVFLSAAQITKLPNLCYSNRLDNSGSLGRNKEIQPQFVHKAKCEHVLMAWYPMRPTDSTTKGISDTVLYQVILYRVLVQTHHHHEQWAAVQRKRPNKSIHFANGSIPLPQYVSFARLLSLQHHKGGKNGLLGDVYRCNVSLKVLNFWKFT